MTHPVAHLDQLAAAAADAHARAEQFPHVTSTTIDPADASPFARWVDDLTRGDVLGCEHVTDSPRVVHGLLSAPGLVLCPGCFTYAAGLERTERPHRCDVCDLDSLRLRPVTSPIGPVIVTGHLCRRCCDLLGLPPEQVTS
jgi:hypothetical protein